VTTTTRRDDDDDDDDDARASVRDSAFARGAARASEWPWRAPRGVGTSRVFAEARLASVFSTGPQTS
jgi:hypothetical protein